MNVTKNVEECGFPSKNTKGHNPKMQISFRNHAHAPTGRARMGIHIFEKIKNKKLTLEIRHFANLERNLPGEIIHVEIQIIELGQPGNLLRYFSIQSIEVQVQPGQALELSQGCRYRTREALPL